MFGDFAAMIGTYETRKVDRYENKKLVVSTAAVTDSEQPYETAISHPSYNDGKLIIVEMYNSKIAAQRGHDKWVKTMKAKKLPAIIKDVSTSGIVALAKALGMLEKRFKKNG